MKTFTNESNFVGQGVGPGYGYGGYGYGGYPIEAFGTGYGCGYSNGYGYGNIGRWIARSESEIRESVHHQSLANCHGFHGISRDLCTTGRDIAEVKHDLSREILQNRFETERSTCAIKEKVDRESDQIKRDVRDLRFDMDKQFCETNHLIERGFADVRERELRLENNRLRGILDDCKSTNQTHAIVDQIKHAICNRTVVAPTSPAGTVVAPVVQPSNCD